MDLLECVISFSKYCHYIDMCMRPDSRSIVIFESLREITAENVYVRIKDTFIVHTELETLSFCLYGDS